MVNVKVGIWRPAPTQLSDRHTARPGELQQIGEVDGVLEETTAEERQTMIGLDKSPSMRFIAYRRWLLKVRDRLRVLEVKHRWRDRDGHLSGAEFVVLSVVNSFRGAAVFLGPAQAEV